MNWGNDDFSWLLHSMTALEIEIPLPYSCFFEMTAFYAHFGVYDWGALSSLTLAVKVFMIIKETLKNLRKPNGTQKT